MKTTTDIRARLAALSKMTATQLREEYRALFGEESRSGNRQWLYRRCAWRLQALAEGDLSERARARARELAREVDIRVRPPAMATLRASELPTVTRPAGGSLKCSGDARLPMPGTLLTRKYKDQLYQVEVLDGSFAYDGQVYQSLSAVAQAITGSHWNGYLFFGLADKEQR